MQQLGQPWLQSRVSKKSNGTWQHGDRVRSVRCRYAHTMEDSLAKFVAFSIVGVVILLIRVAINAFSTKPPDIREQYATAATPSQTSPREPAAINEEGFYEIVATELQQQTLKPAIWTKAFADAGGSLEPARALYIRYRVLQLAEDRKLEQQEHRRTATKSAIQRTAAGFRRFCYALLAVICGLLSLFCLLGIAMLFSPETLGGGIFMVVFAVLFGCASYQCARASRK